MSRSRYHIGLLWIFPLLVTAGFLHAQRQTKQSIRDKFALSEEVRLAEETLSALNVETLQLERSGQTLRDEIRRGFAVPGLTSTVEAPADTSTPPPTLEPPEKSTLTLWQEREMKTRELLIAETRFRLAFAEKAGTETPATEWADFAERLRAHLALLERWDPVQSVLGKPPALREQNRIRNQLLAQESQMRFVMDRLRAETFDKNEFRLLSILRQEDIDFPRGFLHFRIPEDQP